jgi:hypothetical protein
MTIRWRALGVVLSEAWAAWLCVVGFAVAWLIGWVFSTWVFSTGTSGEVRYAGTFLQILGLIVVVVGLRDKLKQFKRPTVPGTVRSWFGRLARAFRRPEPITVQLSGVGAVALAGELQARLLLGPGASIEQRVRALEANLAQLQEELNTKVQDMRKRNDRLAEDLRQETEDRKTADRYAGSQIEEVAIGGWGLEVVGLLWLLFGVLGTSIPDEVGTILIRLTHGCS